MGFQLRKEHRPGTGNLDGTFHILEDPAVGVRVDVWPALGFNCLRWQVHHKGQLLDLLYVDPQLFENLRPTRAGIPVLFPFPNRIRDGRFTWAGKDYQLPLNDSSGKNAIHGFACRKPWRVVDQGADEHGAWITGEFHGSVDAPESRTLWPADYRIRLTYRLGPQSLGWEIHVDNPDQVPLPFGLGFHPYLCVPLVPESRVEDCWVEVGAHSFWELDESLPVGERLPVDNITNLIVGRRYSELNLDALLTELEDTPLPGSEGLPLRGRVRQSPEGVAVNLLTSPAFRELVVFTPQHRQAVCLEPYTCATDAINLQQRGVDAGLLILQPGETWSGLVQMVLE